MVFRAALIACALSVVRADYWLQRSWPSSSTCDTSTPSITYVDTGVNFNIQNYNNNNGRPVTLGMCNSASDGSSTLTSCYNSTYVLVNSWSSPTSNCNMSQPQLTGYPTLMLIAQAGTGLCTANGGSSTLGACMRSTSLYVAYASEPVVTYSYSSNYVPEPNCTADYPVSITSVSLALPPCAAVVNFASLYPDGGNNNVPTIPTQIWGSIAITASCMSGNVSSTYYQSVPSCFGTPSSAFNFTAGICTSTSSTSASLVMPFTSACGGGAAAASTSLSAGAIVGIVIGVIFLAGLAAAAFMFCGGGLKRKALFFSSDDVTVMKP